jgi:peptidoglycan/xylan/chitin deacetylase (PgdA/CDA1 family)
MNHLIRIVQCWDDGVEDDIRLCSLLRSLGAKATFNLNAGLHGTKRGEPWRFRGCKDVRRLAKVELKDVYEGFDIANHTLNHPSAEKLSPAEWEIEVVKGRERLGNLFGRKVEGFAYPFGHCPPHAIESVRRAGHLYARTCANATPSFPPADPMLLAPDCHFLDSRLWSLYEKAKAAKALAFYFWGHSYELCSDEDWRDFARTLRRFQDDPEAEWGCLTDLFK